jgi:uncharacterized membrane-anchored protein
MKKTMLTIVTMIIALSAWAQNDADTQRKIDSVENLFTYQTGTVELSNGIGKINIPEGFKYLDAVQAEKVLVEIWGNPRNPGMTLGMILPKNKALLGDSGYVFNIQYNEIGFVKDDDADDIDYSELLSDMQKDAVEENKSRQAGGYEPISIDGWAAKPFYDKDRKILHWAMDIKFGDAEVNTLNYHIRVLGRKGILVLNAIAPIPSLPLVQNDIHHVLNIVQFNDGYRYKDFDPSIDQVAAWTIGGLVAGKLLAKVGLFAVILKFWKLIAIAVAGIGAAIWKRFKRKKDEATEEEQVTEPQPDGV